MLHRRMFVWIIGIAVLVFWTVPAFAQNVLWSRAYGGSGTDWGSSVQQTTDGGYIVSGHTYSFGAGSADIYLIKTNSLGDTLWIRTYGGSGTEAGCCVQQTEDGGYIVAAPTYSFGAGGQDVYLIKTNSLGDTLWTRTYGGSQNDRAVSVHQTTDGGYILVGCTESFGAGYRDVYLIKTDCFGSTEWTRAYGGSGSDGAYSVQQTADGGYIVAGKTNSFGAGGLDGYLIKTDSLGDTLWTRTYGGSEDEHAISVQQTTDGGYIVAGYTESFGAGLIDVYLIKTDSLGDTLWAYTYGGSDEDTECFVQQTADGGYIVAGYTESLGSGGRDAYLIKTDSLGDTLWSYAYGGSGVEMASSVQQTEDEGYIVAGYTESFGAGSADIMLTKMDSRGNACIGEFVSSTVMSMSPIVTSPPTVVTPCATVVTSPPTEMTSSATEINTICERVYVDTLFISTDTVCLAPHSMKVTLTVHNQNTLSAMTIPLHYETDCPEFTVDSVRFWGTRIENWESKTVIIKPDTVILGLVADFGGGTPPLPPGEGPIGYVYFSIPCDTANVYDSCFIAWDTTTVQPESQHLLFVDNHESEFIPSFAPGTTFVALYRAGDVNGNCTINVGDIVYLISYLFKGGPEPKPLDAGDVNGDCSVDIGDVVYLVNYLYKGGPPPVCGCASHPELIGSCHGCDGSYSLRKTAGPAEVGLVSSGISKEGAKLIEVDGSFGVDVAGAQLEFSYDPDEIQSIIPELTDRTKVLSLFFSASNGILKIGIVDLAGEHVVPAGEGSLVRLRILGSSCSSLQLNKAILVDEGATPFAVAILPKQEQETVVPRDFILSQNHPNPFNPETEIRYTLPEAAHVRFTVYNMLGQKVKTLVNEYQAAGRKTVNWDGTDELGNKVASGIYFYRIHAGEFEDTKKMILMK